jgi:hypothetical protein
MEPVLASQRLRRELLLARRRSQALVQAILGPLRELDPQASEASLAATMASKRLVEQIWKALPGEERAHVYGSPEDLVTQGGWCLARLGSPRVTLHLGWQELCFDCSLDAAWRAWPRFCSVATDAYNAVIYPETLSWALVRAGRHLYPLRLDQGENAELMAAPETDIPSPDTA